jgi:hypothetical protein
MNAEPLSQPKGEFSHIIDRISIVDSPVGIDAQYTHAIIITYLQQIAAKLEAIEAKIQGTRS